MTHSTKILAVNCKQLSNNIIDPYFYGTYGLAVSSKMEPQWAKYPNPCVRSFMRSEKLISEFYSVARQKWYST
jgi:hypothetical protein